MKRKNVIRTLTVVAVVLLLGWSFFYFSDDTRGYHQVDTSVAVAQINAGNVTGAQIDDREQQVRLDLKSVGPDTDNSNKITGSKTAATRFERYLYYLGPTPKIIFFPLMILWFGVGPGSKVALGALSCFFPVALAAAAGMREIPFILKCVGTSLRATPMQKALKIYLPAMRGPAINGLRMGFGVAVIGVLLAETKLSNQGLGYLVIQNYQHFDMQAMYALLIAIFGLAVLANAALSHWAGPDRR